MLDLISKIAHSVLGGFRGIGGNRASVLGVMGYVAIVLVLFTC